MSRGQAVIDSAAAKEMQDRIWDSFRRWGFLQANLDPLGDLEPVAMPELDVTGPEADAARLFYCGTIGAEFMHIPDRERREWIQERMESEATRAGSRANSRTPDPRRNFRAGFADALPRHEALFARRRSGAASAPRRNPDAPPPNRARRRPCWR